VVIVDTYACTDRFVAFIGGVRYETIAPRFSTMEHAHQVTAGQMLLGNKPDALPMAVWRRLMRMRYLAFLYFLAWLAYVVFLLAEGHNRSVGLLVLVLWGMSMFGFDVLVRWNQNRMRTSVLECGFRMCTHCGYRLTGLPASHCCPECGTEYTTQDLEEEWRAWLSG